MLLQSETQPSSWLNEGAIITRSKTVLTTADLHITAECIFVASSVPFFYTHPWMVDAMFTVPASLSHRSLLIHLLHLYYNTMFAAGQFRSFYSCASIPFLFVLWPFWPFKLFFKDWTYLRDTQSGQNLDFSLEFKRNTQDRLNSFIIIITIIFKKAEPESLGGNNCLVFTAKANVTRTKTVPGVVPQQPRKILVACGFNSVMQFNLIQTCWVYMLHLLSHLL